jgi:hypothetical protein
MDAVGLRVVDRTATLVDPVIDLLHVLATRPALLETTTPAMTRSSPASSRCCVNTATSMVCTLATQTAISSGPNR